MVRTVYTDRRGNPITFAQRRGIRWGHYYYGGAGGGGGGRHPRQASLSTLTRLVQNRSWDAVIRRTRSHPAELWHQEEGTGNTPLHMACRLDPPTAVIVAMGITSRAKNYQGATPLHFAACHRCSAQAIRALLDCGSKNTDGNSPGADDQDEDASSPIHNTAVASSPAAGYSWLYSDESMHSVVSQFDKNTSPTADLSRMGRAPIHYACMSFRGLNLEAFQALLDATLRDGNLTIQDQNKRLLGLDDDDADDDNDQDDLIEEFAECDGDDLDEDYFQVETDAVPSCQNDDEDQENLCDADGNDLLPNMDQKLAAAAEEDPEPAVVINVMSLKDATGQTPLALLFRRYRERVRYVISRVDRLRREHAHAPEQASLAAAMTVHADLGELWEKARWIVARLTEERLQREGRIPEDDPTLLLSPGEAAVAQEAASWATEQYRPRDTTAEGMESTRLDLLATPATGPTIGNHQATAPNVAAETASATGAATLSATVRSLALSSSPSEAASTSAGVDPQQDVSGEEEHEDCSSTIPAAQAQQKQARKFRIVHASVGLTGYGCPPEMIRLALSIHPQQCAEMDEDGNLPLHIAVTASSFLATAEQASNNSHTVMAAAAAAAAADGTADDLSVLSDTMSFFSSATVAQTSNPFDKVIKILLQQYPDAAKIPQGKSGRLPLVLAIESKRRSWEDGLRTLLNAYPPALHNKKLIEPELYPHVLSLVQSSTATGAGRCLLDVHAAILEDMLLLVRNMGSNSSNHGGSNHHHRPTRFGGGGGGPAGSSARHANRSKRQRQEANALTTMFQLLRAKPEWLTRRCGSDDSE